MLSIDVPQSESVPISRASIKGQRLLCFSCLVLMRGVILADPLGVDVTKHSQARVEQLLCERRRYS